jgi:hypothetical protein
MTVNHNHPVQQEDFLRNKAQNEKVTNHNTHAGIDAHAPKTWSDDY